MDRKSWCDGCVRFSSGVYLYDVLCLDCGKLETATSCPDCVKNGSLSELTKCTKCKRDTLRRVNKSLFPEAELGPKVA